MGCYDDGLSAGGDGLGFDGCCALELGLGLVGSPIDAGLGFWLGDAGACGTRP